jgi:hypothetical protein
MCKNLNLYNYINTVRSVLYKSSVVFSEHTYERKFQVLELSVKTDQHDEIINKQIQGNLAFIIFTCA